MTRSGAPPSACGLGIPRREIPSGGEGHPARRRAGDGGSPWRRLQPPAAEDRRGVAQRQAPWPQRHLTGAAPERTEFAWARAGRAGAQLLGTHVERGVEIQIGAAQEERGVGMLRGNDITKHDDKYAIVFGNFY